MSADGAQNTSCPKVLGLFCEHSVALGETLNPETGEIDGAPGVRAITFPCSGMIKPSFIRKGLALGAQGVAVLGCAMGDCHYREGNRWIRDRLLGNRPPKLKGKVDVQRVRLLWMNAQQREDLLARLQAFQEELTALSADKPTEDATGGH